MTATLTPSTPSGNLSFAGVPQGGVTPGEVASEPVVELARPAAAGLMSAAQAAVRLSGGDCGTMIWTTKVKGALLCLHVRRRRWMSSLHGDALLNCHVVMSS